MKKVNINLLQKILGIPGDQFPSGRRSACYVYKKAREEFRIEFVKDELVGEILENYKKEFLQYNHVIFFIPKDDKSFINFSLVIFKQIHDDFIKCKYETGLDDLWLWSSKVIFILLRQD